MPRARRRGHALAACVFALVATRGVPARAAPPAPSADPASDRETRAAELKKRGDDLLDAKRYAEALTAYDAAYAIAPSALLLYNRGRALQFLGRYPEALDAIERFAREAPPELRARVPGLPRLLEELRAKVGTLVVRCPVEGARVLVDDKQVGVTPVSQPLKVAAGRLSIDVFADGYFPLHHDVELTGGASLTVDFALVSRDTSGLVTVRSHGSPARISIDERTIGLSPVEAGLVAGTHRVVAERDGWDSASTQIVLRAGERRDVWLDPIARASLASRWWFWTAIGVVVAGGIVTVIALTTERPAPSGNYSPGTVHF